MVRNNMTDSEFRFLQVGDKISASRHDIKYDAIVRGTYGSYPDLIGVQIGIVWCEKSPDADYVWKDYRTGATVTEQNRPSMQKGWYRDGTRRG